MQPEEFQKKFGVSRETFLRLHIYHDILLKWQKAINLISPGTVDYAWQRHFADSAQISNLIPKNRIISDLGSGAGFPGLVLAIMRPDLEIHLIESDERKSQFLKTVSRETNTNVKIHTTRVEKILKDLNPDFITARGFAAITEILKISESVRAKNPAVTYVLLKGRGVEEEAREAKKLYGFAEKYTSSLTDSDARIITITNVFKRD